MMVTADFASENDLLVFQKKKNQQKQVKREKLNLNYI